jgi:hypothetical protein
MLITNPKFKCIKYAILYAVAVEIFGGKAYD